MYHVFICHLWCICRFTAKPITSLQPVTLVEGQTFRPAALCRSVAKPMASLSWDTDLAGQSQKRSSDGEVASIQFSLHPLRNMNGQKLDCLVWHPSQKGPVRISNNLVVHCESWSLTLIIILYQKCLGHNLSLFFVSPWILITIKKKCNTNKNDPVQISMSWINSVQRILSFILIKMQFLY